MIRRTGIRFALLASTGLFLACTSATPEPPYPVQPELFVERFGAAEGITFNGEGEMFVAADRAVWRVSPNGSAERLAEIDSNLGQAGVGSRDILQADFGPTNVFRHGDEQEIDGVVWRITPDGDKRADARGIADPNAILVLPDGSYLVSDDGTDVIYRVTPDPDGEGQVLIWTRDVPFPNGLVLSPDHRTVWVAQVFSAIGPVVRAGRLWAVELRPDGSSGAARMVAETGADGADGLAADAQGRIYIADNGNGRVLRYDPADGAITVIAEGVPNIASLVFGEGHFDRRALYATTTFRGGGDVWKIPVGAPGLTPIRRDSIKP